MPHPTTAYDHFLNKAGKIPLLTPEEEIVLGRQVQRMMALLQEKPEGPYTLQERGALRIGKRAKDRMTTANIRLVAVVAGKYFRAMPQSGMPLEDMMSEGLAGLIRGVEKYDPSRGYKFSTYAYWWIRQAITRSLHTSSRMIRLPMPCSEKLFQLNRVYRELQDSLGRVPTSAEIAQGLGIKQAEYEKLLYVGSRVRSLDELVHEDGSALVDLMSDNNDTGAQLDELSTALDCERLESVLKLLNETEERIIRMRFGIGNGVCHTYEEIGQVIGVSRERIRQVIERALNKMRLHLTQSQQFREPLYGVWALAA